MSYRLLHSLCASAVVLFWAVGWSSADGAELPADRLAAQLAKVRAVGSHGQGHREAAAVAKQLAQADAAQLPEILAAMNGAGEVSANWLRGIAESVAQRSQQRGAALPAAALEKFLLNTKESPRGRRLAYELIAAADETAAERLIPQMLNDPSLELRRDAVAQQLGTAAQVPADDKPQRLAAYEKAFRAARDLDQIKEAAAKLRAEQAEINIARHMGFVTTWQLIGPFDNVGDRGWDTAYPPEKMVDLTAEYDGQKGKVKWFEHTTTDDYGNVDLTKALDKHKGAVTYASAEFASDGERLVDVRLGSTNAVKLWVNGDLLDARHVYHSGTEVDQYISRATLKPGKNLILVKVCQNEQTDGWAQDWKFQLRVCDAIGTAVLSQDRASSKTAAVE